MASGPITSWEIDGETVETVSDFIFLSSKITADGDCSHEMKRHSLPSEPPGNPNDNYGIILILSSSMYLRTRILGEGNIYVIHEIKVKTL